jgi:hypothetical protein
MIRLHRVTIVLVGILLAAGCGEEADSPSGPDPVEGQGIPIQLVDPDQVIASVAMAWEHRDSAAMSALLAPDFRFYIRDDEATEFPWLPQAFWDLATELGFAGNMFDPDFTGANPPVQSIEFQFQVLDGSQPQPGTYERKLDAVITVLTGPADGWRADTRFDLVIREQPDGFLRLSEMREIPSFARRGESGGAESSSWGAVKNLYR